MDNLNDEVTNWFSSSGLTPGTLKAHLVLEEIALNISPHVWICLKSIHDLMRHKEFGGKLVSLFVERDGLSLLITLFNLKSLENWDVVLLLLQNLNVIWDAHVSVCDNVVDQFQVSSKDLHVWVPPIHPRGKFGLVEMTWRRSSSAGQATPRTSETKSRSL